MANVINLGADLGAMGDALVLLIGGPAHLYVVGFAVGCALLETFSRYERYVVLLKWSSVFLLAYVATALVVGYTLAAGCLQHLHPDAYGSTPTMSSPLSLYWARPSRLTASSGNPPRRPRTSGSTRRPGAAGRA